MIDVKELKILNQKGCRCDFYEFSLADVKSIEFLQDAHGFYGNLVKHYSKVICPECGKETIVLLKQLGQTWEIMNTAISANEIVIEKSENSESKSENVEVSKQIIEKVIENTAEQTESQNEQENNSSEEYICPKCKKVCKNKCGLSAHMKTHQN